MDSTPASRLHSRLGLHYYPDTQHYRQSDLETWLPELRLLGAGWLVLQAPSGRAIPESFLRALLQAGIEPLLHFPLSLSGPLPDLTTLFHSYASWGVHYVVLFDRPNLRLAWGPSAWTQADLVENFIDRFLPTAEAALEEGLAPVFPPLEPGGDYWDTAFLRRALQSLQRRKPRLLESLAFSAVAWSGARPLHWGAGGPERWPASRPYATPPGGQDQRGFRIFDWYLPLIEAELGSPRPLFLLQAGSESTQDGKPVSPSAKALPAAEVSPPSTTQTVDMARLALADPSEEDGLPDSIRACCFWLLTSEPGHPAASQAWFPPVSSSSTAPAVQNAQAIASKTVSAAASTSSCLPVVHTLRAIVQKGAAQNTAQPGSPVPPIIPPFPIAHYLLLPRFAWGPAAYSLDGILALFPNTHPTLGFSLEEARLASRVTVFGGEGAFPNATLELLQAAGCQVERGEDLAQNLHTKG